MKKLLRLSVARWFKASAVRGRLVFGDYTASAVDDTSSDLWQFQRQQRVQRQHSGQRGPSRRILGEGFQQDQPEAYPQDPIYTDTKIENYNGNRIPITREIFIAFKANKNNSYRWRGHFSATSTPPDRRQELSVTFHYNGNRTT